MGKNIKQKNIENSDESISRSTSNGISKSKKQKGYAILFTVVIVSAISVITAGLSNAAYKQLVLSSLAKDSQLAFYQADTAGDCALYADRVNPFNIITTGGPWSCGNSSLVVTPTTGGGYTIYPTDQNSTNPCFRIDVTKTITSGGGSPSWQSGMVSWWKLDGDTTDSVGIYNGTVNGATSTNVGCKFGSCYSFNGLNNYINVSTLGASTSAVFDAPGEITLSAWIKPNVISWQGIIGTGVVKLHINSGPGMKLTMYYPSGTRVDESFSAPIVAGTWQHVAMTYDRTTGNLSAYLNGENIFSKTYAGLDLSVVGDSFAIGQNWGDYFNGSIDEAMAWNRALSPLEIQDVYNYTGSGTGSIISTEISAKGYNICKKSNIRTVEREIQINYKE